MTDRFTVFRRVSIGLTVLGLAVAAYLTWTHFTNSAVQCFGGSKGCDIVQESSYSSIGPVPVALLGLLAYLFILFILLIEERRGPLAEHAPLVLFGVTLVGVAYSAYLTYLELFVILAICQYCVTSALIMAALFGIAAYRVLATPQ